MFDQRSYGTDPQTGLLDYDKVAELAREFKPLVIVAGYSAYPRRVNFAKMREIADEVGAVLMVDMAHFAGLVAGKVFTGDENPIPHAQVVTTTTHKSLRGPRGGMVLTTKDYADDVDRGCQWCSAARCPTSWLPSRRSGRSAHPDLPRLRSARRQ